MKRASVVCFAFSSESSRFCADFGEPVELGERRKAEIEQVGRRAHEIQLDELVDDLLAGSSMSSARRCAKCHCACAAPGRTGRPCSARSPRPASARSSSRTPGIRSASRIRPHRPGAGRAARRPPRGSRRPRGARSRYRRSGCPCGALRLVVQRRVRHGRTADEHGLEARDRRDRAGAADLHVDRDEPHSASCAGNLCASAKRGARDTAEALLFVAPVDLCRRRRRCRTAATRASRRPCGRSRASLRRRARPRARGSRAGRATRTSRAARCAYRASASRRARRSRTRRTTAGAAR